MSSEAYRFLHFGSVRILQRMANPERWKRFADLPEDLGARLARLPALFEERGVRLAYLFGSLAADDPSPGDVDLALLTEDEPAYELRADLQRILGTQRLDLSAECTKRPLLHLPATVLLS